MSKHFVFGHDKKVSKKDRLRLKKEKEDMLLSIDGDLDSQVKEQLYQDDNLIHVEGRIVVKLDIKNKDSHTFESGLTIRRERNFNNFNRRETQPVNVIVISGEGIPKGAELLIDHNALHETNRINDYKNSFENDGSDRVRYFSIETYECYAWRMGNDNWQPIRPFEFALRVFKPYKGFLVGIDPEVLKDTLFVTSGELKGNVIKTVKAADYEIIFQNEKGTEGHLICFRPFGYEKRNMPEEAIAILNTETEKLKNGELLLGYSLSDCKPLNEFVDNNFIKKDFQLGYKTVIVL